MTRLEQENSRYLQLISKGVTSIVKLLVLKELHKLDVYDDGEYETELKKLL